jgi:predicted ATPase
MVSELSPIVSYLRYILTRPAQLIFLGLRRRRVRQQKSQPRALLIIEEPEAHLHPENQAKITEIFAKLTKVQVKVILTSHSNYVFNKTNNLVLAGILEPNNIQATVFAMTETGSIGKRLAVDELGIDDENFIETAEKQFDEKSDLIDRMNSA